MADIITKVSETQIEVKTIIPEQVIPEQVITKVVSIEDLEAEIKSIEQEIMKWQSYRDTPLAELAKIDEEISRLNVKLQECRDTLAEALAQGVKKPSELSDPIEKPEEPLEEIINP